MKKYILLFLCAVCFNSINAETPVFGDIPTKIYEPHEFTDVITFDSTVIIQGYTYSSTKANSWDSAYSLDTSYNGKWDSSWSYVTATTNSKNMTYTGTGVFNTTVTMNDNLITKSIQTINQRDYFDYKCDEFIAGGGTAIPPWAFAAINSGTSSGVGYTMSHGGSIRISTSTTSNSGARYQTGTGGILIKGQETSRLIFQLPTINDSVMIRFGYHDASTSTAPVDGIYFEIYGSTLIAKSANNSTYSTTASNYNNLITSTTYEMFESVNIGATQVNFYLFDSIGINQLWFDSLTTNIPTGVGRQLGNGIIATSSDTTVITVIDLDFIDMNISRKLTR